jgi:hypothetical protein
MSHKQSKIARRAVRAIGKHPREVELVPTKPIMLFDLFGAPRGQFLGQRNLLPACGRAIYRMAKKADRKGLIPVAA